MAVNEAGYRQQLVALSPPGLAWNSENGSEYSHLIDSFAAALAKVDGRVDQLLDELDPRTATELLPDWERLLGLPDACTPADQTLQERRIACHAKYIMKGGQSEAYFIKLAETLGHPITITVFKPFITGLSCCGNGLYSEDDRFVWKVSVNTSRPVYFRTGESAAGEKLLQLAPAAMLECIFRRLQPSHTTLVFDYS